MGKRTRFNKQWLEIFKWLEEDKDSKYNAKCRICSKTFFLSNMGKGAVTSHEKSKGHKDLVGNKQGIKKFMKEKVQPHIQFTTSSIQSNANK